MVWFTFSEGYAVVDWVWMDGVFAVRRTLRMVYGVFFALGVRGLEAGVSMLCVRFGSACSLHVCLIYTG